MLDHQYFFSFYWIYLFLSISHSLSTVSEVFCVERFEVFAILLAILLPIKSPRIKTFLLLQINTNYQ